MCACESVRVSWWGRGSWRRVDSGKDSVMKEAIFHGGSRTLSLNVLFRTTALCWCGLLLPNARQDRMDAVSVAFVLCVNCEYSCKVSGNDHEEVKRLLVCV